MCLGQRCLSKRCLGQSQLNLNLNLNLAGSGVLTSNLSMSPPFLRPKNITPEISNTQFSFFDVGCFLFSKKGRERALACVAHQSKQILCKDRILFFGGVIFCGEGLWEKGRGECFFCFPLLLLFFLLSVSFPFCLRFLLCLLVWLALFDLA